jgi:hypothetical protein
MFETHDIKLVSDMNRKLAEWKTVERSPIVSPADIMTDMDGGNRRGYHSSARSMSAASGSSPASSDSNESGSAALETLRRLKRFSAMDREEDYPDTFDLEALQAFQDTVGKDMDDGGRGNMHNMRRGDRRGGPRRGGYHGQ